MERLRHRRVRVAALSFLALGCSAAAATGCGGGSNSSSTTPTELPPAESSAATAGGSRPAGEAPAKGSGGKQQSPPTHHFKGGESEVEEFGSEAGGSESAAVLAAEQGYLAAIAHRNYDKACSLVSSSLKQQFDELVATGGGGHHPTCQELLPHILAANASHVAALQLSGKVLRVRVNGNDGFVVFHAPGARLFAYPMTNDREGWRVGSITSSVLAPSAATLGEG
jgi:hypothetical protein